jgi:hypothetical protein
MKDPLVYVIADLFQVNLHKLPDKSIRGARDLQLPIATMWEVSAPATVVVDENTDKLCTAFARIYGNLWCYAMATSDAVSVLFFDGTRVKIRVGAEKEFGLGSAAATMKRLQPHITRAFSCSVKHGAPAEWTPLDLPKA